MKKIINIVAGMFIIAIFVPMCSTTYISADEIGIRKAVFGGIVDEDFGQGRQLNLPFFHSFYTLPRTFQYLNFRRFPVRNNQNNQFFVDTTVIYKVIDGEGYLIGQEGLINTWQTKVKSVCEGFLRVHLAQLSNEAILRTEERLRVAKSAVEPLNKQLRQYHVEVATSGVVIRAISFEASFEGRLQAQQLLAVQAQLDTAKEKESEARMKTDTVQKGIEKDVAVQEQEWNKQIADLRLEWETKIAEVGAESQIYRRRVRAEADAYYEKSIAQGDRALAEARALGERLKTQALNTRAGETYSAILAARNFKLGQITLNSSDPSFLRRFASMASWREFFLPK